MFNKYFYILKQIEKVPLKKTFTNQLVDITVYGAVALTFREFSLGRNSFNRNVRSI